jgi:hypothetical protein
MKKSNIILNEQDKIEDINQRITILETAVIKYQEEEDRGVKHSEARQLKHERNQIKLERLTNLFACLLS